MSEHDGNDTRTDTNDRTTDPTEVDDDEEFRSWTDSSGTGTVNIKDMSKVYGTEDGKLTAVDGMDVKDVIDVDLDQPRDTDMVTTDRFNELQRRTSESIHDEAERAMEQAEGQT